MPEQLELEAEEDEMEAAAAARARHDEMKEGERLKRYYFYELQYVVFIGIQYRNMRCITSYQLLITHDHCCNPVLVLTHDHCYKSSVVLTHHLQAQGYRAP